MNVLNLLEENKNQTLSGEVIAKRLDTTRANVWKEISKLRKEGYKIVATPSKGYKLIGYGHNFSEFLLNKHLHNLNIEIHEKLKSTNDLAKKSSQINRLIIAQSQTHGRGRMGKSFYSPKYQGLYFSYVIKPKLDLERIPLITVAAALAVVKALPIKTDIKWLNDILVENKKIAGILVEADIEVQSRSFNKIIVGVGINLFKSDVPSELKEIITTVEDHTKKEIDKTQILIDFIHEFDLRIKQIVEKDESLIRDYQAKCVTLNKMIRYQNHNYKAIAINEFGNLIVKDENNNQTIIQSGEINDQN